MFTCSHARKAKMAGSFVYAEETHLFDSETLDQAYFAKIPVDRKYTKTEMRTVRCSTAFDNNGGPVQFSLDALEPPDCYLTNRIVIQVEVKLVGANGEAIPAAFNKKLIGPIDNIGEQRELAPF